jgi:ubiquinone/menaquinone biosynthesis C-methylase UbiE
MPERKKEKAPDPRLALAKYRKLAPTYDRAARFAQRMRRLAVDRLELGRGDVVLDIGCGTGLAFPLLESRIGPEGRLIGVDLSPDMLAEARQRVKENGWPNVTLIEASVEEAEIPIKADAWVSVLTHDVMRSPKAIENVLLHMKPGGRIAVAGAKWAPWWALPVNAYVGYVARRYVTTFEGFDRPWTRLEALVPGLKVRPILFGGAYLAFGDVRSDRARGEFA